MWAKMRIHNKAVALVFAGVCPDSGEIFHSPPYQRAVSLSDPHHHIPWSVSKSYKHGPTDPTAHETARKAPQGFPHHCGCWVALVHWDINVVEINHKSNGKFEL